MRGCRARKDKSAGAKYERAEKRQPLVAQQVLKVDVSREHGGEDEQQVCQIESGGARQDRTQAAEQKHVRQAEVMKRERNARGIKLQVGEEEIGLPGKEKAAVPAIPKQHVDVVPRGGQPETARVKDFCERGPGHDDDREGPENEDAPMIAQQRAESRHDRRHPKRGTATAGGRGQEPGRRRRGGGSGAAKQLVRVSGMSLRAFAILRQWRPDQVRARSGLGHWP